MYIMYVCVYIYCLYVTGAENEAHYYQKGNRKKNENNNI